jgi:DHA2 family multidrug resistance protein
LPISGWLALRLGRRNYFLLSIAIFTLASVLCGIAGSLGCIIASRALQGVAGGGLQPSSQAVLLDAFPQEKQGQAMTIFGMAALLAPVVGPTLGGYITDNYGWHWIFYLNVPVGLLAYLMCHALVEDPEYLQVEWAKNRNRREPFDVLGLCLLTVTISQLCRDFPPKRERYKRRILDLVRADVTEGFAGIRTWKAALVGDNRIERRGLVRAVR